MVRWEYPLFVVDSLLDPTRLKQAGGLPRLATQTEILDLLDEKPLKAVEWQKRAREEFGIASSTFYSIKNELQEHGRVESIAGLSGKNEPLRLLRRLNRSAPPNFRSACTCSFKEIS